MYRISYGKGDGIVQIIVKDMSGVSHFLVVESFNDTYGDLKDVARPHIMGKPARHQLALVDKDDNILDDKTRIISSLSKPVEPLTFQIFVKDAEWDETQQAIIRNTSGERVFLNMSSIKVDLESPEPLKIMNREAFIWGIEHNPEIKSLIIENAFNIEPIMSSIQHIEELHLKNASLDTIRALSNVLGDNTTIKSLIIEDALNKVSPYMRMFFESIVHNDGLINLTMIKNKVSLYNLYDFDYEMAHLNMMLRFNTSLRTVYIKGYTVKIEDNDRNLTNLAHALLTQTTLQTLHLSENRFDTNRIKASEIISSLQPVRNIIKLSVLDGRFVIQPELSSERSVFQIWQRPMIEEMVWVNPNVDQ